MADELLLSSFEVDGFRAIRRARFPEFGRINLFVGKNNAGKTSLLQALQLYLDRNSDSLPGIVVDLVRSHADLRSGIDTHPRGEQDPNALQSVVDAVEGLFHGSFFDQPLRAVHVGPSADARTRLSLSLPWSPDASRADNGASVKRPVLIDPREVLLALESEATLVELPLDWFVRRLLVRTSAARSVASFVPSTGFNSSRVRELWDRVVLSGEEHLVEQAVRTVVPDLERILVIGELRLRRVLVKLRDVPHPVPLNSLGDGANRVFGLSVALVQARGGVVLMDEVENGLHHSVQTETWDSIFALAEQLDVQVFATTHSWDAVVGFQESANRHPAKGMLYRLEREDDGQIYAEAYTEEDVAVAAEQQVEVR